MPLDCARTMGLDAMESNCSYGGKYSSQLYNRHVSRIGHSRRCITDTRRSGTEQPVSREWPAKESRRHSAMDKFCKHIRFDCRKRNRYILLGGDSSRTGE